MGSIMGSSNSTKKAAAANSNEKIAAANKKAAAAAREKAARDWLEGLEKATIEEYSYLEKYYADCKQIIGPRTDKSAPAIDQLNMKWELVTTVYNSWKEQYDKKLTLPTGWKELKQR